jgi:hypothetical protein
MSGGYVKKGGLKRKEHQTVIFTFKGPTDAISCDAWNTAIRALKRSFVDPATGNPGCVIGVTLNGPNTPPDSDFIGGPEALERVLENFGGKPNKGKALRGKR